MAKPINLSTIGVELLYAVETTAGTRPSTGFKKIQGMKSTPSMNPAPDTLETTTFDELEYKTYIDGLKDLGGTLEFTFNLTQELVDEWDELLSAYETGKASQKATWFAIVIPGLDEAFFFTGNPSNMGIPEMGVNSVLETTNYIVPTNAPEKFTKPTKASA